MIFQQISYPFNICRILRMSEMGVFSFVSVITGSALKGFDNLSHRAEIFIKTKYSEIRTKMFGWIIVPGLSCKTGGEKYKLDQIDGMKGDE